MKISTKGRYALRVMIDLAEHNTGEYIPLMDIARRQDISEKYLEAIVATLSKNDFLISLRGKGGGYKLARNPEDYSVLEKKPNRCPKVAECKTLQMWEDFEKLVNDYFSNITIADLVNSNVGIDSYII